MNELKQVGLIPMSAKPLHIGHDMLIRLAAQECDTVELFVSLSDRGIVTGEKMKQIWMNNIFPHLPLNVNIHFSAITPVRDVYELLGNIDKLETLPNVMYNIYSDAQDVYRNFPDKSLNKYLPKLMQNIRIMRRGIERHETVQISGELMREHLKLNNKQSFFDGLPDWINKEAVWSLLKA